MLLNLIFVGLYLLAVLVIGWRAGRKETSSDFIIASRKVGFFRTTASVFAVLGGEMLIVQPALSYALGLGALWFWVGIAVGMILLGLAAPKFKELGDKYGFINLSEYFGLRWGTKNRIFAAIIIFITFFALLAIQFMAVGFIIAPLFHISYPLVVIASGLVVLIYLLLGGYKAVINTDLLQAILMVAIMIGLPLFMDIGQINFSESISVFSFSPFMAISFLIIGIIFNFQAADMWQRIYSARSSKTARNSLFAVAALFLIFGFFMTLIGIAAKNHFPNIDPNEAFFWGLSGLLPFWLLGAAVVMILATIMSTVDTEVYMLASNIAKDFIARTKKEINDAELAKIIRPTMIMLTAIATLIAIFVKDIITMLFGLISFGLSLSPAIIASLFWKLKSKAVFSSMVGGVLAFLALIILGQFNPDNAVLTLPVALIFLIAGQIIFKGERARLI